MPAEEISWSAFKVLEPKSCAGSGPVELPPTGAGMLIAWVAGPRLVRWSPIVLDGTPGVNIYRTIVTGENSVPEAPNVTDQAYIDNDNAEYLFDAEVPRPPALRKWYLVDDSVVSGLSEVVELIEKALDQSEPTGEPRSMLAAFQGLIWRDSQ